MREENIYACIWISWPLTNENRILKNNINELLNFDNDIPTEENLNSENWKQELLKNYIKNSSDEDISSEIIVEQNASNKITRSKHDVRQFLQEIEIYIAKKYPSIIPDFVHFRSVYLDISSKKRKQSNISNFFMEK